MTECKFYLDHADELKAGILKPEWGPEIAKHLKYYEFWARYGVTQNFDDLYQYLVLACYYANKYDYNTMLYSYIELPWELIIDSSEPTFFDVNDPKVRKYIYSQWRDNVEFFDAQFGTKHLEEDIPEIALIETIYDKKKFLTTLNALVYPKREYKYEESDKERFDKDCTIEHYPVIDFYREHIEDIRKGNLKAEWAPNIEYYLSACIDEKDEEFADVFIGNFYHYLSIAYHHKDFVDKDYLYKKIMKSVKFVRDYARIYDSDLFHGRTEENNKYLDGIWFDETSPLQFQFGYYNTGEIELSLPDIARMENVLDETKFESMINKLLYK